MPLKAVLSDWDGTLTKSTDALCLQANNQTVAWYKGRTMDMPEFAKTLKFGTNVKDMLAHLGMHPELAEEIERERNACYNLLLAEHAAWMDGAQEFLDSVRSAGLSVGVTTHARRINLNAQKDRLGFDQYINVFVTKDDMELKDGRKLYKPDPYSAQLAAEKLAVPLSDCCYFGDLTSDIEMAAAAGIPGILIPGPSTDEAAFKVATRVYGSLRECREKMKEWL